MDKNQELRVVNDYEVLGVGAARREAFTFVGKPVELRTHPALVPASQTAFYDAVLAETRAWLNPAVIRPTALPLPLEEFLLEVLLEDFRREFSQTVAYIKGGIRELLKDYLKEVPWQGPLVSAHFRYLPVFLKRKFQDPRLYLIAQKEWLWSYLSFADFGFPPPESGRVIVNPSLQSLYTVSEVPEVELVPGLTVFYYHYAQKKVCTCQMDLWGAALVDELQEDRKFTSGQLLDQVQMMELEAPLSRDQWAQKLSSLKDLGIILELFI